jgi:hypothetical protein
MLWESPAGAKAYAITGLSFARFRSSVSALALVFFQVIAKEIVLKFDPSIFNSFALHRPWFL